MDERQRQMKVTRMTPWTVEERVLAEEFLAELRARANHPTSIDSACAEHGGQGGAA